MKMNTSAGKWAVGSAAIAIVTLGALSNAIGTPPVRFAVVELVTDDKKEFPTARFVDPDLVNAWGLAVQASGVFRTSNNGTATSTQYKGDGQKVDSAADIAGAGGPGTGEPTGIALTNGTGFLVPQGTSKTPATAFFASEDGTISALTPGSLQSVVVVNNSITTNAVYKGIAIANAHGNERIFATDFRNARVDIFDEAFQPVIIPNAFVDPNIPAGFAPFGIRALKRDSGVKSGGGVETKIIVTYAKQDAAKHDDVAGVGNGFVDAFDVDGNLLARIATQGPLNSPWGLAVAPAGFDNLGGALLVGNFGDGMINAYDLQTNTLLGTLRESPNKPITIDGLWGLEFGNGANGAVRDQLYFTAGPNGESHGLFGFIKVK